MENLYVSSAPHIHTNETISSVMKNVVIALIPATIWGIFVFGFYALAVILTAIASCILSEHIFCKIIKKPSTVGDFSAVVTGLLIGLNMPPAIPLWMVVVGSAFAIIIVKELYGGLGKNFVNPALAARCFMLIAWTGAMTTFNAPFDAVSSATPLAVMKGSEGIFPTIKSSFLGLTGGCIGEVSVIALLLGFIYLKVKRIVKLDTTISFLLSFFILTLLFGKNTTSLDSITYSIIQLFSGGLMLGSMFMATDYVTTPTTPKGHIIFGIGCGVLTFLIRQFGGYPDGASFAILLMNVASPLIENYTMPKAFGHTRKENRHE